MTVKLDELKKMIATSKTIALETCFEKEFQVVCFEQILKYYLQHALRNENTWFEEK